MVAHSELEKVAGLGSWTGGGEVVAKGFSRAVGMGDGMVACWALYSVYLSVLLLAAVKEVMWVVTLVNGLVGGWVAD